MHTVLVKRDSRGRAGPSHIRPKCLPQLSSKSGAGWHPHPVTEREASKSTVSLNLLREENICTDTTTYPVFKKCLCWESEARRWFKGRPAGFRQICLLPKTMAPVQVLSSPCPDDLPRSDSIWNIQAGLTTDTPKSLPTGCCEHPVNDLTSSSWGCRGWLSPEPGDALLSLCFVLAEPLSFLQESTQPGLRTVQNSSPQPLSARTLSTRRGSTAVPLTTVGSQPPCGC